MARIQEQLYPRLALFCTRVTPALLAYGDGSVGEPERIGCTEGLVTCDIGWLTVIGRFTY
jgi:hypothetical protein